MSKEIYKIEDDLLLLFFKEAKTLKKLFMKRHLKKLFNKTPPKENYICLKKKNCMFPNKRPPHYIRSTNRNKKQHYISF